MNTKLKIVGGETMAEVIATNVSALTGRTHTRRIVATKPQIDRWRYAGALIQDAMPQLSSSDREFLLTGIVDDEWEAMFGDEFENERGTDGKDHLVPSRNSYHADGIMLDDEDCPY